jgi:hypothetical protein
MGLDAMISPANYDLCVTALTTAQTNAAQTAITGLAGMSAANILVELLGATGGSTAIAIVQTTFDDGTTWLDIARFDFTTVAGKKYCIINNDAAKAVTAYAALGSEGVNNGLLGDRLRAVLTSTGTYTDTTLSVRVAVH